MSWTLGWNSLTNDAIFVDIFDTQVPLCVACVPVILPLIFQSVS